VCRGSAALIEGPVGQEPGFPACEGLVHIRLDFGFCPRVVPYPYFIQTSIEPARACSAPCEASDADIEADARCRVVGICTNILPVEIKGHGVSLFYCGEMVPGIEGIGRARVDGGSSGIPGRESMDVSQIAPHLKFHEDPDFVHGRIHSRKYGLPQEFFCLKPPGNRVIPARDIDLIVNPDKVSTAIEGYGVSGNRQTCDRGRIHTCSGQGYGDRRFIRVVGGDIQGGASRARDGRIEPDG